MDFKKMLVILNGFIHDFASGIWLAVIITILLLHDSHIANPEIEHVINGLERHFFWVSIAAFIVIMATGAGRTFTYVDNWYGQDAEKCRKKMLLVKHIILLSCFGIGYFYVFNKVFH